ncbi:hypothetical protein [Deinococcus apachensis]|uniref:hypothetical protein n=1 Tax=Deinococcus apachensis TaxID=309886 RepID=UPI001FDFED99|nr:hypothetical protein [Deinococcus apachensis]
MKALRVSLLTLITLGGAAVTGRPVEAAGTTIPSLPALPAAWQAKLAGLAPKPGQVVQLMEQRPSLALVGLQQRVTIAGGSREALSAVMASVQKGDRPAYDERLNISREEFQQYLVFQPVLTPSGRSLKLPVTREGNRLKFGDVPGLRGVLRGLTLDLVTGELRTPEGFTGKPRLVTASTAPDRSIDIRGGFVWSVKGTNPATQNALDGQLQLLQLPGSQVILSYSRTSILHGRISEGDGPVILRYSR